MMLIKGAMKDLRIQYLNKLIKKMTGESYIKQSLKLNVKEK